MDRRYQSIIFCSWLVLLILAIPVWAGSAAESSPVKVFIALREPPPGQRAEPAMESLIQRLTVAGVTVGQRFRLALNGVVAETTSDQLPWIATQPEVKELYPIGKGYHPATLPIGVSSSPLANLAISIPAELDGRGINIGIMDTGIDYLHVALGGPGTPEAYGANNPNRIDDRYLGKRLFPTMKVVGGYDFVGALYDPDCSRADETAGQCSARPQPDPDPMDDQLPAGHGTHVASVAAGLGYGAIPPGVAPAARLWALKIFGKRGRASGEVVAAAIEWAMDPNGDGNTRDHLDVLNLSLSCDFSCGEGSIPGETLEARAASAFIAAGGIIVGAAGNSGDVPFVTGGTSASSEAISVASSIPLEHTHTLEVRSPAQLAGYLLSPSAGFTSPERFSTLGGSLVYGGRGCDGDLPFTHSLLGQIVLLERGNCLFEQKIANAEGAGAIALIISNDQPGPPFVINVAGKRSVTLPTVMIARQDGETLKTALGAGETPQIAFTSELVPPDYEVVDTLSPFSSRGPGVPYISQLGQRITAKPDITAPGNSVLAASSGTGYRGVAMAGTSMAAPYITALVALLRQLHPDWLPIEIKAALMNTADPHLYLGHRSGDQQAPLTRRGAGLMNPLGALATTALAYANPGVTLDLGFQPIPRPKTFNRTVTLANKGVRPVTYRVSFALRQKIYSGVKVHPTRERVTVPAHGTATLEVVVVVDPQGLQDWQLAEEGRRDPKALDNAEYDGQLLFTPLSGGDPLRVPFYLLARRVSAIHSDPSELRNGSNLLTLINDSEITGNTEIYHLVGEDGNEPLVNDGRDIRAVGVRLYSDPQQGEVLEFAFATYDYRVNPDKIGIHIYLDTDGDGKDDFGLFNRAESKPRYGTSGGTNRTFLKNLRTGNVAQQYYITSGVLEGNIVLPVPLQALGLTPGHLVFSFWVAVFRGGPAETMRRDTDLVPDGAITQQARFQVDLDHPSVTVGERHLSVGPGQSQVKVSYRDDPSSTKKGLLLLYPTNEPGLTEAQVVNYPLEQLPRTGFYENNQ